MLAHRRFPEEMFTGPEEWKDALRRLPPPGVAQPGGEAP
jgi:hypothetical protein